MSLWFWVSLELALNNRIPAWKSTHSESLDPFCWDSPRAIRNNVARMDVLPMLFRVIVQMNKRLLGERSIVNFRIYANLVQSRSQICIYVCALLIFLISNEINCL